MYERTSLDKRSESVDDINTAANASLHHLSKDYTDLQLIVYHIDGKSVWNAGDYIE
jgi:hypothetical protein